MFSIIRARKKTLSIYEAQPNVTVKKHIQHNDTNMRILRIKTFSIMTLIITTLNKTRLRINTFTKNIQHNDTQ